MEMYGGFISLVIIELFGLVSYDDPRFLHLVSGEVWTSTGVPAICIASRYLRDQRFEGNCFFAHEMARWNTAPRKVIKVLCSNVQTFTSE